MQENKRLTYIVSAIIALLLIPLIAMQFNTGVEWTLSDFVVAGALLFGVGLSYEWIARSNGNPAYRKGAALALLGMLLLIWINLAVGIIGNENNPLNGLYFGVVAIGIGASLLAQFRSVQMSAAMWITAVAQALVPFIALYLAQPSIATTSEPMDVFAVFILSGFFACMFAGSALLFRKATV
jgi:hypothetical protein